jgi:hypothetical protein
MFKTVFITLEEEPDKVIGISGVTSINVVNNSIMLRGNIGEFGIPAVTVYHRVLSFVVN